MFYDVFIQLCKQNGIKPAQISRDVGISQSTISMWKSQGTTPTALTVSKLAKYFNTTPEVLLETENADANIEEILDSGDEARIYSVMGAQMIYMSLKQYAGLNPPGMFKVMAYIDKLRENPKYKAIGEDEDAEKE